jgi:hypothetical protein
MAKHSLWYDEYWLLIMQLYLRKPVGIKPKYNRESINLCLELHFSPEFLFERMCMLANPETPKIEILWEKYANNPSRLSKMVKRFREMNGFNHAEEFYKEVEINETFEKYFKPINENFGQLSPMMLIIILNLYFRLTPITMVIETPEIINLGKKMKVKPETIVDIMDIFQHCDPYLHRNDIIINPLLQPCQDIWIRYGSKEIDKLDKFAEELMEYFR